MFVQAILLLLIVVVVAFILQGWFKSHPVTWSKYVFIGLFVIWVLGLIKIWSSYPH